MKMREDSRSRFWRWQMLLAAGIALFPLYGRLAPKLFAGRGGCFLHDWLSVYCPLCGGTRAVSALLRLDIAQAFRLNAFVVLLIALAIGLDIWAFVRLRRGRERLLPLPNWSWIVVLVLAILFAILRNYLMIAHGIDPTGDLGRIWNG